MQKLWSGTTIGCFTINGRYHQEHAMHSHDSNSLSSVSPIEAPLRGRWNLCVFFPLDPNEAPATAQARGAILQYFEDMKGVQIREIDTAIIVIFLKEYSKDAAGNLIFRIPQRLATKDIIDLGGQFLIRANEEDWQERREGSSRLDRHLLIVGDGQANRLEFNTHVKAWADPRELGRSDRQDSWRATVAAPHLTLLRMSMLGSGEVSFRATNAQILEIGDGDVLVHTGTIPPRVLRNADAMPGFAQMHDWAFEALVNARALQQVFGRWPEKTKAAAALPRQQPSPSAAPSAITQRSLRPLPPNSALTPAFDGGPELPDVSPTTPSVTPSRRSPRKQDNDNDGYPSENERGFNRRYQSGRQRQR